MAKNESKKDGPKKSKADGAGAADAGAPVKTKSTGGGKNKSSAKAAKGGADKKDAGKKKDAKKAKAKAKAMEPSPVKTGKGASVEEVGAKFVEMFNASGMNPPEKEIWAALYNKQCRSIEGGGMNMAWDGLKAMKRKAEHWYEQNTLNSVKIEGPYVGATGFGVKYTVDITCKQSGDRMTASEFGFYTVKNGKVVQEEFMGLKPGAAS